MIDGYGLVKPMSLEEFVESMAGCEFDKEDLEIIHDDIQSCSYDKGNYVEFDKDEILKNYGKANILYPKDRDEYYEWLDNKDLGLKKINKECGFIEDWIKEENIISMNIERVLYRE